MPGSARFRRPLPSLRRRGSQHGHFETSRRPILSDDAVDEIDRSVLRFEIEPTEIFADDAEHHELHAAKNENNGRQAGPAGDGMAEKPGSHRIGQHTHADRAGEKAKAGGKPQRDDRKAGYAIEGEAQHLAERIACPAGETCIPIVDNGHLRQTDPAYHSANESMLFRHGIEKIEDLPADKTEVAGIERNLDIHQAMQQAIEDRAAYRLEPGPALAYPPWAENDTGAAIHQHIISPRSSGGSWR